MRTGAVTNVYFGGKSKHQLANAQLRAALQLATRQLGYPDSKDLRREFHDKVSGEGLNWAELLAEAFAFVDIKQSSSRQFHPERRKNRGD